MKERDEIIYIIDSYLKNKYNIKEFCNLFSDLYYYEKSYYRFFKDKEKELLDELANMVECFSDDIDDLKKYPSYYISDYQLDKKIKEVQRYFEKKLSVRSDN